jgi:hypothetical protein
LRERYQQQGAHEGHIGNYRGESLFVLQSGYGDDFFREELVVALVSAIKKDFALAASVIFLRAGDARFTDYSVPGLTAEEASLYDCCRFYR